MNVLLAAGPESTTLFTIAVQEFGRPAARSVGRRHITVPLNRLQATYRRILLAGDAVLSVTRCQQIDDPPRAPHGLSASEAPSVIEPPPPKVPHIEETVPSRPVENVPEQARQGQAEDETAVGEDAMVLLLSVLGVLILFTLRVAQYWARQWGTNVQARHRPDPPVVGAGTQELANC